MSTELLHYCLTKLRQQPKALNIMQPLTSSARRTFANSWSRARFEEQQQSILRLPPDHPDYGRSYLWPYELHWEYGSSAFGGESETQTLRIECNPSIIAPPRELILLASVSTVPIPFTDAKGNPHFQHVFRAAKSRMLGGETKRQGSAVFPALKAGVANVQYVCQSEGAYLTAINLDDVVSVEN